ncbi:hypothetical protein [Leptolyngbya sp. BL0902]|uniref:hypothetical protein n=1 Tax=Leptolyngbya sp. BL0902 TaxID=1115757 RepID=UPI0018E7581C|nr:hypothetical protein [Leptolyngbya sp. BL0902]
MPALSPWPPTGSWSVGATAALLRQSICDLSPLTGELAAAAPDLMLALDQLTAIVMKMRSPTVGWPADTILTPNLLAPYISEEVWNVLERLSQDGLGQRLAPTLPTTMLPIPSLIPRLLWMLASSGYEVMHLVEGGRATVRRPGEAGSVSVIRLVPVLTLATEQDTYALDLVTQADPSPSLWLTPETTISLLDYDLDGSWISIETLTSGVLEVVAQTQPALYEGLTTGWRVQALCPFQPWQTALLRLHLFVADMGVQGGRTALATDPSAALVPAEKPDSTAFTLDDFANTLMDEAAPSTEGILGNWLTFTDEAWVRRFLHSHAQRVLVQGLPKLISSDEAILDEDRELACATLAYQATQSIDGPKALFKHTFVRVPVLVADLWPRFRWYLAQSSERVMQLMGGLPAQVLSPGRGWQQGILSLRPLMQLTTSSKTWIIDLGSGRLLPTLPLALPGDAVIETTQAGDWANHQTIATLIALVNQDLAQYAPAMAELAEGTDVHLRDLAVEEAESLVRLTLHWCFTWAYES